VPELADWLAGRRTLVLDTETTGFDPRQGHRLVEAAALAIDGATIAEGWSSLIQPGRSIPADATAIHGIDDGMVASAPDAGTIAPDLRRRCADHTLVFHNVAFDLPFLRALFEEGSQPPIYNPVVDTLGLSRGLGGAGHSLEALAARFGLPRPAAHRALSDATTTAHLFLVLAERWRERGVRSLAELAAVSQDALRWPRP
jgi:DNA polymerase III epsilon subunit family exonuclease